MHYFVVGTHGVTGVVARPLGYTGFIYRPGGKCSQHVMAQSILPFTASVLSLPGEQPFLFWSFSRTRTWIYVHM